MGTRNHRRLAVLLILSAAIALSAAVFATSAAALPTFTQAVGGIGPCDSCHTQTGTHGLAAHASVYPTCSNCHVGGVTGVPPTPTACAACHGGTTTILGAHPSKGCSTTPGCHGVVVTTPTVTSFTPTSGAAGTLVTVTGTGFPGATAVTFHGVAAATFTVVDPSTITVKVPAGATSGAIAVSTSAGTGTSATSFTVAVPKPKIVKLSPTSGKRGSTVTITGTKFGAKRATSVVKFGTAKVTKYVSWSDGKVKVKVPAKAKFGRVKVSLKTSAGVSNTKSFKVKR